VPARQPVCRLEDQPACEACLRRGKPVRRRLYGPAIRLVDQRRDRAGQGPHIQDQPDRAYRRLRERYMSQLNCHAELQLDHLPDYLDRIVDRLASFEATVDRSGDGFVFDYRFGTAFLGVGPGRLAIQLHGTDADGLQRVRGLVTVAIQVYAKVDQPQIVWKGALSEDRKLITFRKMRVRHVEELTPRMRRVRLEGENLARYGQFGGMHVRVLFPTPENPEPVWPVAGPNGQPVFPSEERRPAARVYTIRNLDVVAGFMDLDFVVHGGEG